MSRGRSLLDPASSALASLALACTLALLPRSADAAQLEDTPRPSEGPEPAERDALPELADLPALPELVEPRLSAPPAMPAMFVGLPPIAAKRSRDRNFDTSMGEVDPRGRELPRTHRFRLTLHAHYVRLTRAFNDNTQEFERFHYAPMHLDLGYQAQFLKYVMVRLALGIGGNVANTRNAQPVSLFPQAYVGVQGKVVGAAFGYGFDWTLASGPRRLAPLSTALEQPWISRNHVVMGEFSVTSRIDRTALTFALAVGGMQSQLIHYAENNKRFRFYLGLHAGAFFDGTKRREKRARKRVEAEGRAP
ncbi:hypothetical protein PPSIR1_09775 [Plesiocystis pacifica SIR-1]|uniref:Uncharacterized protein n=1 Tax=Plesiocystis pacifica SIR-1 TaxID=391625 RepID=A6G9R5_9BACT|nr:hypothetical protein [Plesiocystis pacifica]EDM77351.1 hypothetical protein PPSIR1_09775 [Plesiocystis pacifica SIR-1]